MSKSRHLKIMNSKVIHFGPNQQISLEMKGYKQRVQLHFMHF